MLRTSLAVALGVSLGASAGAQTKAPAQAQKPADTTRPVWPDEGPRTWAPRPTVPDITANDLRTRLYQFADDSMMGRRIGELGNYKGTAYIASEFKRLGLKPAGDNGTFFQDMPYGPIGFDSAASRLIAGGAPLTAKTEWIPLAPAATNGLSNRADLTNVQTVFAGRWGDTTALDPAVFRGKVAVFSGVPAAGGAGGGGARGNAPVLRCDSVPDKFGAAAAIKVEAAQRADSVANGGRGGRGGGRGGAGGGVRDTRASAAGAVAILFVGLDAMPANAVTGAFTSRGAMQPAAPAPTAVGGAVISSAAAAKLFGKPIDQLSVGATGQPVSGSWNYAWTMSKTPARNVIAILPGSDPARAGEYVLVSAHNDHVGVNNTAVDHDSLRAVNMVTRRQGGNDPGLPAHGRAAAPDRLAHRARAQHSSAASRLDHEWRR